MKKRFFFNLLLSIIIFIFTSSPSMALKDNHTDSQHYALVFEHLKNQLSAPSSLQHLTILFNQMNQLKFNINHHIEENNKKLQEISSLIDASSSSKPTSSYEKTLNEEKNRLKNNIDEMNIILYEIKDIKHALISIAKKINPYSLTIKNTESIRLQWKQFSLSSFTIHTINYSNLSSLVLSLLIYFSLPYLITPKKIKKSFLPYIHMIKIHFFQGLTLSILCYGFIQSILSNIESVPVQWVNFRPPLYTLIFLFIFIFSMDRTLKQPYEFMLQQLLIKFRLFFLGASLILFFSLCSPLLSIPFLKTILLLIYITALCWISLSLCPNKIISFILLVFYLILIIMTSLGYQNLGLWCIPNLFTTATILFFFYSLNQVLIKTKNGLTNTRHKIIKKMYLFFGLKKEQTLIELLLLRYVLLLGLIVYVLVVLSELWGVTAYEIHELLNSYFINHMFKFNIVLFLRSIILFCILTLIARIICGFIVKPIKNKQTQEAARFFLQSLAIIINIIIICLILKINITAIIAISTGLSIGIGFGLQRFASDVIYGIYINTTKMFQPGDQVRVPLMHQSIEGSIKKIGLIFTQITTSEYSDLFVPNNKICEQGIINYNYQHNTLHVFKIKFILEHMSDIERGKDILLKIAKKQADILQDKQYQPKVELDSNHLVLECTIKNISLKNQIITDMELQILKTLSEKNIPVQLA